ncbi:hypothetical protein EVG20_g7753 [Dentipellis fragilis]|uniref:Uncharacterized protein n=1 Tax=Dentipellis fragilis TaxID=205917 RepID=A0A4Y9YBL6_9AGAM|nr:hypothetical protein EVG20_g7753 [Dentipellis fragilis]
MTSSSRASTFTTACLDLDSHDPVQDGHIGEEPTLTILSVLVMRKFLWLKEAGLLEASVDWRRNIPEWRKVD